MRRHVTFANVTSLLALFIALGGTSYAVATNSIGTRQIKNNSVRSVDVRNGSIVTKDVKRGALGSRAIKESSLGTVPKANRVGGKTASDLRLRCPSGTRSNMGSCIEQQPRPAQAYGTARVACEVANRRLPTHQELVSYTDDSPGLLAPGGELTANVSPRNPPDRELNVVVVVDQTGGVDVVPSTFAGSRAFRCVTNPTN